MKTEATIEERAAKLLAALRFVSPGALMQGRPEDVLIDGTFDLERVVEAFGRLLAGEQLVDLD